MDPVASSLEKRKPVIIGKISENIKKIIRRVGQTNEVEILSRYVGKDHIPLFALVQTCLLASKLLQYVKGNSYRRLQMKYKELNKQF